MEHYIECYIEEEREFARALLVGIQNNDLRLALPSQCYEWDAPAIPDILTIESIPPYWAHLVLRYHAHLLTDEQHQQLVNAIATNPQISHDTLHEHVSFLLKDTQVKQLIDVVAQDAGLSYGLLYLHYCRKWLTDAQVRQLIDVVAQDEDWSHELSHIFEEREEIKWKH